MADAVPPDRLHPEQREAAAPPPWLHLLPALAEDDPDEAAVTNALLDTVDLPVELDELVEQLADLLEHATSAGTRRAYAADWADFTDWAGRHRLVALPAEPRTVALYVTAQQSRLRPATLLRRRSAIAVVHRGAGQPSPTGSELVRRAVAGLRRKHGARPAGKTALVTAPLSAICVRLHALENDAGQLAAAAAALQQTAGASQQRRHLDQRLRAAQATALRGRRDRALLLLGYAAALRRSELVALDVADLVETEHGLQVFVARSKTDQTGLGEFVGVAHGHPPDSCTITCPVRAWAGWRNALAGELEVLGEPLHPLAPAFRPLTRHGQLGAPGRPDAHGRLTGQSVALIVKAAVALLADPLAHPPERYAGHSLAPGSPPRPPPPASPWTGSCARPGTQALLLPCATSSALGRSGTTTRAPPWGCSRAAAHQRLGSDAGRDGPAAPSQGHVSVWAICRSDNVAKPATVNAPACRTCRVAIEAHMRGLEACCSMRSSSVPPFTTTGMPWVRAFCSIARC